jgi:Family of unknown function (DUF6634)
MTERNHRTRLRALIADLKRLASGWRPDATMLAKAPVIEDWYADHYPDTRDVCLVGKVTGHPILGDKIVTTSPVMAIDPQYQWARTHNRFYRLGKRAQFRVIDTDSPGRQVIDV